MFVVNLKWVYGVFVRVFSVLNGQMSAMCIRIREMLLKNMDRWRAGVNVGMKLRVTLKCGKFLDWLRNG